MIPFDPTEPARDTAATAAKPVRPLSTDDIIVRVTPDRPPMTPDAIKERHQINLQVEWDYLASPDHLCDMRTRHSTNAAIALCLGTFTVAGGRYAAEQWGNDAAQAQKQALAQSIKAIEPIDAPLANTSQVVLDIRTTDAGAACWAKYTSAATETGTIHSTTLQQCLRTEHDALQLPADTGIITMGLSLTFAFVAWYLRSNLDAATAIQKEMRQSILTNPEYNGQPLPGPFKIKQATLKLDRD